MAWRWRMMRPASSTNTGMRQRRAQEIHRSRVLTRVAFGFHSAEALIALAMLALGSHRPALPGRA